MLDSCREVVMATRSSLSYRDYAALPDDGRRYELHEGQLSVTPAPGTRHQMISARSLRAAVPARAGGSARPRPLALPWIASSAIAPSSSPTSSISRSTAGHRLSERAIEGPPTLAIEIVFALHGPHQSRTQAAPVRRRTACRTTGWSMVTRARDRCVSPGRWGLRASGAARGLERGGPASVHRPSARSSACLGLSGAGRRPPVERGGAPARPLVGVGVQEDREALGAVSSRT